VNFREQLEQLRANALLQQQQQSQQTLANAARQPIPGLTGPTTQGGIPGQPTVGMAPPQQPLPAPPPQPFMASGPYGQQAAQLAGLLGGGNQMIPPPGNQAQHGLLGAKGLRMPFYRPVGK
jgi:hypothetical protein